MPFANHKINHVHVEQEESLWPMSDSRQLKEKFDDIFAATRYVIWRVGAGVGKRWTCVDVDHLPYMI